MDIIIGGDREPQGPEGTRRSVNAPPVPWKTLIAGTVVVGGAIALVFLIRAVAEVLLLVALGGFLAVVLAGPVSAVQRRVGGHRGLASGIVITATLFVIAGLVALFVFPLRHQLAEMIGDLPGTIRAAINGRGPLGPLVRKLHLEKLVRDHAEDLRRWAADFDRSSTGYVRAAINAALSCVTVLIIAFFFLTQSQALAKTLLGIIPMRRKESVQLVGADAARAVSGYMTGNLLISLIAGLTSFVMLLADRVPNAVALAVWVAFTDLIPLVGATVGAIAVVVAAFLESTTKGVIALVFFVIYQQIENAVLQPIIMKRTVNINPLAVLLSVLIGVRLMGLWGALFAIPVASCAQIFVAAMWHEWQRDKLSIPGALPD